MPAYKTHISAGLLFSLVIIYLGSLSHNSPGLLFFWVTCAILGSLFPDIDTQSKGRKIFYSLFIVLLLICLFYQKTVYALYLSGASLCPLVMRHRGLFHNIWFLLLLIGSISILLGHLFPNCSSEIKSGTLFFALGVISHLWLDLGFKNMLKLR